MKRIAQRSVCVLFLAALVFFAPLRADATPLLPGQTSAVPDLAGIFDPGTLLASLTSTFNTGYVMGEFRTAVYRNSWGLLDFYYQVVNQASVNTVNNQISGVSALTFAGAFTSARYRTDAFGMFAASNQVPITAERSVDGSEIIFWFGPPWGSTKITAGETSSVLMLQTNATQYGPGGATVQNHGMAYPTAFQPTAVPEPSTTAFLIMGALGFFGVRRRLA